MSEGITAIIVDDDQDTLEVFSEYLGLSEIDVLAKAKDGKKAVEIFDKFKPEIVLLDVIMPEYDGFYALEKIREINPSAKVIFVTAATAELTQRRLFKSDASALIFKPFDMKYLLKVIESVRNGHKVIPNGVRAANQKIST